MAFIDGYEEKAQLILNGGAELLDDGKVVMLSAKRFNEDFWDAYSKQIPRKAEVVYPNNIKELGMVNKYVPKIICPTCKNEMFDYVQKGENIRYCDACGQKIIFEGA